MGAHLDLDDVVAGHPVATQELKELRDEVVRLRALLQEARDTLNRHRILIGGLGPRIDAALGEE